MEVSKALEIVQQKHDDILALVPSRKPSNFEMRYMLDQLDGVRPFSQFLYGENVGRNLWMAVDSATQRLNQGKSKGRRWARNRRSTDRIRTIKVVEAVEMLDDMNAKFQTDVFPAPDIPCTLTIRMLSNFPNWCRSFFGNNILVRDIPGWRRYNCIVTHPMLLDAAKAMFMRWHEIKDGKEYRSERANYTRQKRITKILEAATQGVAR
jgi:hypothetical protein